MNDDTLKRLLTRADAQSASPSTKSDGLAAQVRSLARRRQARGRRIGAACSASALLVLGVTWWAWLDTQPQRGPVPDPGPTASAADPRELARLGAEVEALRDELRGYRAEMRRWETQRERNSKAHTWQAKRALDEATAPTDDPLNRAAMILVLEADRRRTQYGQTAAALADYQRVIELFPNTPWADTARQRLAAMNDPS